MGGDGGLIATVRVFAVAQRLTYPLLSLILERQRVQRNGGLSTGSSRRLTPLLAHQRHCDTRRCTPG